MKQESKKPFFARLLESQQVDEVQTDLKAGGRYVTLKYPSDDDEWPPI